MTPMEYLKSHQAVVIEAYEKNGRKPKPTWESLLLSLPGIQEHMKFNTFKVYVNRIVESAAAKEQDELHPEVIPSAGQEEAVDLLVRLHQLREEYTILCRGCYTLMQELEARDNLWCNLQTAHENLQAELSLARQERDDLQAKLQATEVTPIGDNEPGTIPKRFEGWTVQVSAADRKIRLFRRIGGKLQTVYAGVNWDPEKVRERIREKMAGMV